MIRLKSIPEDFQVSETIAESIYSRTPTRIHVYLLTKRNYTTQRAVSHIARALNLKPRSIRYAGTKDKTALTHQHITIEGASRKKVQTLDLKDISLSFRGYATDHLYMGCLTGNSFDILLRNLPSHVTLPFTERQTMSIPNYFDAQRFSTANHEIGLHIIRKEFDKAVYHIMETDDDRKKDLEEYLKTHHNDFVGALRLIPKTILLMYVHALQSKFFNDMLSDRIRNLGVETVEFPYHFSNITVPRHPGNLPCIDRELPLIGYDSNLTREHEDMLENAGIKQRDFINKQLPELTLEGGLRATTVSARNISLERLASADDNSFFDLRLKFSLPKGAYATIAIKTILAGILATEQSDL